MIIRNINESNVLSIVRLGNNTGSIWHLLGERCTTTITTQRNLYSSSTNNSDKKKTFKPLSSRFGKSKNGMNELSLEHFLLRDKCVKLWRDFIRASRNIPNPIARRETVDWLRDEHFEGAYGLRNETDVTRIRELLVSGNVALKRVCGPMELVAALNPKHGSFPKLRGRRE